MNLAGICAGHARAYYPKHRDSIRENHAGANFSYKSRGLHLRAVSGRRDRTLVKYDCGVSPDSRPVIDDRTGKYYPVVKAMLGPASRHLWRTKITGLENIPANGGAIIAPNHISFLDSALLMGILPRQILFVGKAEYLDDWKTKYLFPATGMIPIDRSGGKASTAALDAAAGVLESGRLFGIYPEGTRSRSGFLHKGRTGVARISMRTGAPVIPCGIVGTDKIQPPDAAFPKLFQHCEFHFGRPIKPDRYVKRGADARTYREFTDEIMFEIRELSGREYVDRYAGAADTNTEEKTTSAEALRTAT